MSEVVFYILLTALAWLLFWPPRRRIVRGLKRVLGLRQQNCSRYRRPAASYRSPDERPADFTEEELPPSCFGASLSEGRLTAAQQSSDEDSADATGRPA